MRGYCRRYLTPRLPPEIRRGITANTSRWLTQWGWRFHASTVTGVEGVGGIGARLRFWSIVGAAAVLVSGAAALIGWRLHQNRAPFALAGTRPTVSNLSVGPGTGPARVQ
jgi:hypothetical protein